MEEPKKIVNPKTKLIILISGFSFLSLLVIFLLIQVSSLNNSLTDSLVRINRLETKTQIGTNLTQTSVSSNSAVSSRSTSSSISSSSEGSSALSSSGSLVGPKGDTGAQGPQGIQGNPGISGYERICGNTVNVLAGATGGAGANCPSGKKLISFACEDLANVAYFNGATLDPDNTSILCRWWNESGQSTNVKACIFCGNVQ